MVWVIENRSVAAYGVLGVRKFSNVGDHPGLYRPQPSTSSAPFQIYRDFLESLMKCGCRLSLHHLKVLLNQTVRLLMKLSVLPWWLNHCCRRKMMGVLYDCSSDTLFILPRYCKKLLTFCSGGERSKFHRFPPIRARVQHKGRNCGFDTEASRNGKPSSSTSIISSSLV